MIKHFNATFNYYGSPVTISASIPDSWAVYEWSKKAEASQLMTLKLRDLGLFGNSCIHSRDLVTVKKSEKVTFEETKAQIEQAIQNYKEMPNGADKMLIGMSTIANHTKR